MIIAGRALLVWLPIPLQTIEPFISSRGVCRRRKEPCQHNQVERFCPVKHFRRMVTCHEKRAGRYLVIITLAATMILLRELA